MKIPAAKLKPGQVIKLTKEEIAKASVAPSIFSPTLYRERGMTMRAFSEYVGVSEMSIFRYGSGEICPPLPIARRISNILKIPLDLLMFAGEAREAKQGRYKRGKRLI